MNRNTIALVLVLLLTIPVFAAPSKDKEKNTTNFNGVITYIGKVSRIPDRKRTTARLQDLDSYFKLYLNDEYAKSVEDIQSQLEISKVTGIRNESFFQTLTYRDQAPMLVVATSEEIQKYQLTPRSMRANEKKIRTMTGKRTILGHKCLKMVCDMVTEDNIHVQLVAWYAPDMHISGYNTPYFGQLKGLPLAYDVWNGEYVVTYTATEIDEKNIPSSTFEKPKDIAPISFSEFMRMQQEQ